MKNKLKMFFVFSFLLALLLTSFTFVFLLRAETACGQRNEGEAERRNYLLLGLDDAAQNADVILLVSLVKGGVTLLQIPRDTYVHCDFFEGKINRIYNKMRSRGEKNPEQETAALFSSLFGVPLDGYIIFDTGAVEGVVDALGGVEIYVDKDISIKDAEGKTELMLKTGKQRLGGKEAVKFVRYREGYKTGDLGRLDAQARFFGALFQALKKPRGPYEYITIYQKIASNLLTNLSEKDIINIIVDFLRHREDVGVFMMRLPGEPINDRRGISYYVLHQKTTENMLKEHFGGASSFDPQALFTKQTEESFMNAFKVKPYSYRVYTFDGDGRMLTV